MVYVVANAFVYSNSENGENDQNVKLVYSRFLV